VSFTTTTPSRSVLHSSDAGRRPETLFGPAITGGQSSSNLPSHTIVYPSYGDAKSPGVLIASYTWTQDADRMTPVSHEERVRICMNDLVKVHGEAVRDEVIVATFSHSWYEDEHSQGAFALFAASICSVRRWAVQLLVQRRHCTSNGRSLAFYWRSDQCTSRLGRRGLEQCVSHCCGDLDDITRWGFPVSTFVTIIL
jgi:hypothetical protein